MPTSSRRTKIPENWLPSSDDTAYATERGIGDVDSLCEEFRDYHLSRGTLMLDWRAAWRTWCRNQLKWGKVTKPAAPLLNGHDDGDPFGALAFAKGCKYAKPGTMEGGKVVPAVNGWDLVGVLLEVCEVAGCQPEWRGDLGPVAAWLRDGLDPEAIIDAIRSHRPARVPGSWWFYEKRVRATGAAK